MYNTNDYKVICTRFCLTSPDGVDTATARNSFRGSRSPSPGWSLTARVVRPASNACAGCDGLHHPSYVPRCSHTQLKRKTLTVGSIWIVLFSWHCIAGWQSMFCAIVRAIQPFSSFAPSQWSMIIKKKIMVWTNKSFVYHTYADCWKFASLPSLHVLSWTVLASVIRFLRFD